MNKLLEHCNLCGRFCDVNRLKTKTGFCLMDHRIKVSSALLHFGEEPPISGINGSGTVFFSGCSLHCCFCQNYQISFYNEGSYYSIKELADIFINLQKKGAHNINLVTPTHFLPQIIESLKLARQNGLSIPIVYNTSGYDNPEIIKKLDGIIDIYMPDFKFIDKNISKRYTSSKNYPDIIKKNLKIMFKQVGHLKVEKGVAVSGLLVRHLVLPGNVNNSVEIIKYLYDNFGKDTHISLMRQYRPVFKAADFDEINTKVDIKDYSKIVEVVIKLNMLNGFIQDYDEAALFLPDFNKTKPFG